MSGLLKRGWLFVLGAMFLAACGGSGGGDGSDGGTPPAPTFSVTVKLFNAQGAESNTVSPNAPLTAKATVVSNGKAVANAVVTFSSTMGTLTPSSGTALTDANGVASVLLNSGVPAGAGTLKAEYTTGGTTYSGSINFSDAGGAVTGPVPASVLLIADKVNLRSSGADEAKLTAIVKDANNVVLSGVRVNFSSNSGSLSVTQPVTDVNGQAKATLGTQTNPENRTITVTAVVNNTSISSTLHMAVVGSVLTLTGPNGMVSGDTANISFNLRDADGNGLSNRTITVSSVRGNAITPTPVVTDSTGNVTVNYQATNSGNETINASALNGSVVASKSFVISSEKFTLAKLSPAGDIPLNTLGAVELAWTNNNVGVSGPVTFTTTRGTVDGVTSVTKITDANGKASVQVSASNAGPAVITAAAQNGPSGQLTIEFIATVPHAIAVNASPTSIAPGGQRSTINAVVRDVAGNLVKNQTVLFTLDDTTGGSIFPASAVTNSSGMASTVYTSSNTASADNGVRITATAQGTAVSSSVRLTVAQSPLSISFGTGNVVTEPDQSSYLKEFIVFITDANGVARPNQAFTASVLSLPNDGSDPAANIVDSAAYMKGTFFWSAAAEFWVADYKAFCLNEDLDLDGVLDDGEDYNNSRLLTPGNQVALDGSTSFVTNSAGFATIKLRYAQQFAYWMQVRIRVAATVSGTESFGDQKYVLEGAADDFNEKDTAPPGRVFPDGVIGSPFGRATMCSLNEMGN